MPFQKSVNPSDAKEQAESNFVADDMILYIKLVTNSNRKLLVFIYETLKC